MEFPKFFDFIQEEKKIYSKWENEGCFKRKRQSNFPFNFK